jgi:hypothetical protein
VLSLGAQETTIREKHHQPSQDCSAYGGALGYPKILKLLWLKSPFADQLASIISIDSTCSTFCIVISTDYVKIKYKMRQPKKERKKEKKFHLN